MNEVYVIHEAVDFRKGAASLAGYCRLILNEEALNGALFLFRNRQLTAFKMIFCDGQGIWMIQKKLFEKRFEFWPDGAAHFSHLRARQLLILIFYADPDASRKALSWLRGVHLD